MNDTISNFQSIKDEIAALIIGQKYRYFGLGQEVNRKLTTQVLDFIERLPQSENIPVTSIRAHRLHNIARFFSSIRKALDIVTGLDPNLSTREVITRAENDFELAKIIASLMAIDEVLQAMSELSIITSRLNNFKVDPNDIDTLKELTELQDKKVYLEGVIGSTIEETILYAQQAFLLYLRMIRTNINTPILLTNSPDDTCLLCIKKAPDSDFGLHCIENEEDKSGEDSEIIGEALLSHFDIVSFNQYWENIVLPIWSAPEIPTLDKILITLYQISSFTFTYPIDYYNFTTLLIATLSSTFGISIGQFYEIFNKGYDPNDVGNRFLFLRIIQAATHNLYVSYGEAVTTKYHDVPIIEITETDGICTFQVRIPMGYLFEQEFSRFLDVTKRRNEW